MRSQSRLSVTQKQSAQAASLVRARPSRGGIDRSQLGNQAMQRLLHSGVIQAKLSVSQPDDQYEQEADRVAQTVMRMRDPAGQTVRQSGDPPLVQRKCTECEEEVQRKAKPGAEQVGSDFSHPTSGGQALPDSERNFFEPRFGRDFGHVRVHADVQADEAARSVRALAYTMGGDVVFGAGQYQPGTDGGRTLMAHELAHVVQQGAAGPDVNSTATSGAAAPAISRRAAGTPSVQRLGDLSQRPAGMICDPPNSTAAFVDTNILFPLGSNTLTPAAIAAIAAFIARWNAAGSDDAVRVDGFASTDGPEPLNWTLSCDRALAVEGELMAPLSGAPGIPAAFIEMFAHGETSEFSTALPPNRRATISADLAVPPPPVCANPGVSRTLDLQPVFLRTDPTDVSPTGTSWTNRFNEANVIWGKIGIRFNDLGPVTLDSPLKTTGATLAEQNAIAGLRAGSGVEVFLVDNDVGSGVPGGAGGASTAPGCGAGGNIVMSDRGTSNTLLAHELAHTLFNSLSHPPVVGDPGTIAAPSGGHSTANPPRNTMVNFAAIVCPAATGSTCLNPDP